MHGFLNLDKPGGITSRDAVNQVQRLVRPAKVGHAGTLDPLATGVLVVAIGHATRLVEYVHRYRKSYVGRFRLGLSSDTDDIEGTVTSLPNPPCPERTAIAACLPTWLGTVLQRPPAFSAIKVGGRRAYDRARQGEEVALAPRPVSIHSLEIVAYEYPDLELAIECGTGTYIRSLGRDLAAQLHTGAVMTSLRRTAIGPFRIETAVPPNQLSRENLAQFLRPLAAALHGIPRIELTTEEQAAIGHGRAIPIRPPAIALSSESFPTSVSQESQLQEVAAYDAQGTLIALLEPASPGTWKPAKVFAPAGAPG